MQKERRITNFTRRDFMKTSATAAAILSAYSAGMSMSAAAGSERIRVGLIGCGNPEGQRGLVAAKNALAADPAVELVAMGDLFRDNLTRTLEILKTESGSHTADAVARVKVSPEMQFVGWDAYKKVIAQDLDYVILTTPPHFRPEHYAAAVKAGKHVFAEKPVAVDVPGIKSFIETSELARKKKLTVVAGTQRRHQEHYLEVFKRIQDGDIGEVVGAQVYWTTPSSTGIRPNVGGTDMENQIRNWEYYVWACGDFIVEQHVHSLDVMNWALGTHPARCMTLAGRQTRTQPEYGNVFDHFAMDFQYENGARTMSMCRQAANTTRRVSERIVGSKGVANLDANNGAIEGPKPYKFEGKKVDPYVQEHMDLIASIRSGAALNEGIMVAEATMTGIFARLSGYTGLDLTWSKAMTSELRLGPEKYELGPYTPDPIAIPGVTPFA